MTRTEDRGCIPVVISRSGRDKGRLYAVIGIAEDGRLLVADGREKRSCDNPKKKNVKHVDFLIPDGIKELCAAPPDERSRSDPEIRRAIENAKKFIQSDRRDFSVKR